MKHAGVRCQGRGTSGRTRVTRHWLMRTHYRHRKAHDKIVKQMGIFFLKNTTSIWERLHAEMPDRTVSTICITSYTTVDHTTCSHQLAGYHPSCNIVFAGEAQVRHATLSHSQLRAHLKDARWLEQGIPSEILVIKFRSSVTFIYYRSVLSFPPRDGLNGREGLTLGHAETA